MGENCVQRAEYNESIGRIHDKVNNIDKAVARIEVCTDLMSKNTDKIYNVVFGNAKDGLVTKISKMWDTMNKQWFAIVAGMSVIIGTAVFIIRHTLTK